MNVLSCFFFSMFTLCGCLIRIYLIVGTRTTRPPHNSLLSVCFYTMYLSWWPVIFVKWGKCFKIPKCLIRCFGVTYSRKVLMYFSSNCSSLRNRIYMERMCDIFRGNDRHLRRRDIIWRTYMINWIFWVQFRKKLKATEGICLVKLCTRHFYIFLNLWDREWMVFVMSHCWMLRFTSRTPAHYLLS